ncbi:MAG: transglutaminase domain-containing protein [Bradymonadia bacterium]
MRRSQHHPARTRRPAKGVLLALLTAPLMLSGCGGAALKPTPMKSASSMSPAAVEAAEAYYTAKGPEQMRAAVEAARAADANGALYHSLAADLARFEDRQGDEIDHLISALTDPGADDAWLLLHRLRALSWSLDQRAQVESLCHTLSREHPNPEIRALAAYTLAASMHLRGDDEGRKSMNDAVGWRPSLALVGTWNNDQGKGFDAELPPERSVDTDGRYPGQVVQVGWRLKPQTDWRGELDLTSLLSPNTWSIAYAATAFESKAGDYELRLSTGDPVKVWVDDVLVFSDERIKRQMFDGVVLPVTLTAGPHRVLIKSAQKTGSWSLGLRVTGPGGAVVAAGVLKRLELSTTPSTQRVVKAPYTPESRLEARVSTIQGGPARKAFLALEYARLVGSRAGTASAAERFVAAHPESLPGRYMLAIALWDNSERGRTSDMISGLAKEAGGALLLLKLKQARFWSQQKLGEKARALLSEVVKAHPERPSAGIALADIFRAEEWHEERCALLSEIDRQHPRWPLVRLDLADCYEDLRLYPRAAGIYRDVLEALPNSLNALKALHWHAQGNDDYARAAQYAERLTRAWPARLESWRRLAETRRRQGDHQGALKALDALKAIDPDHPDVYRRLGALAQQRGQTEEAVAHWKAALTRAPEDEKLANRLAWLAPEQQGPWADDVPDEKALIEAIMARAEVKPASSADVIYLLDDEVTELKSDGSTINVITTVAHAVNEAGRDRLTKLRLRGGGRTRIFHAFAVGPDGSRIEASSIRGRTVRFRQLSVGTTVVLQYRLDARPDGYLANHLARQWWFQLPNLQTRLGRWVLWAPEDTTFLESKIGTVFRREEQRDGQVRVEWAAKNMAPIIAEPGMPTLHEVAAHVVVSTVPDWDTFWKWEEALLTDAFRETPELVALAKTVFEGASTPQEKVERLQAWIMTEIRYQQDYEGHIAGVKPHAAPMVVARRYGDCKDKAVLFITLARLAGIKAHFALVRTRDAGPVRRTVPMQQFNHAIVYLPAQEGIEQGRFYDPTVDALDVEVLRHDDQGTWSLVFDPYSHVHSWRQIPFQSPKVDHTRIASRFTLSAEGDAQGEMVLTGRGRIGSRLRKAGRNPEKLSQLLQQQVGVAYPGGRLLGHEVVDFKRLDAPAEVKLKFEAPAVARVEDDTLRLKIPIGWQPQSLFTLADRQHPVLMGPPQTMVWSVAVDLPQELALEQLPEPRTLSTDCLALAREVKSAKAGFTVDFTLTRTCERIGADRYAEHRDLARQMNRLMEEEAVISLKSRRKGQKKSRRSARGSSAQRATGSSSRTARRAP